MAVAPLFPAVTTDSLQRAEQSSYPPVRALPQSLHESPSDLVAFLQAHHHHQQRPPPQLHPSEDSILRASLPEQAPPLSREFGISSPVQMALARLLCQEKSRQQGPDYNHQMRMNHVLQGFGALASLDQTNQALSSPPMVYDPWLQLQLQRQAQLREDHFRNSCNTTGANRIHALRATPQLTTPDNMAVRAEVRPTLENPKMQCAWQIEDALNTDRKDPPSMQPYTLKPSMAKTAVVPSPRNSSTVKSIEASSYYFAPHPLAHENDHLVLSQHQIFLRQQIEIFCATEADTQMRARGRNKRITIGQVGIRCRYCAHVPCRQKGSLYYPSSTLGLYQAAQNISTTHMQCGLCVAMPDDVKKKFADLIPTKTQGSLRGRAYWSNSAKEMGLVDTVDQGIRYVPPK
jgi:hypothetical protein